MPQCHTSKLFNISYLLVHWIIWDKLSIVFHLLHKDDFASGLNTVQLFHYNNAKCSQKDGTLIEKVVYKSVRSNRPWLLLKAIHFQQHQEIERERERETVEASLNYKITTFFNQHTDERWVLRVCSSENVLISCIHAL